jgi:hypothetical protein
MNINIWAVILAALAQFVFGAIWYMPLFGKLWGDIHGFNTLSKKERQKAQKHMMPLLAVQFAVTLLTTVVLAKLIESLPGYSPIALGFFAWLGFIVPTQVAAVVFGGTTPKWVVPKIAVMVGASLGCMLIASSILGAIS